MIKATVAQLIKKYGTNDPYEIASQKNIIVLFEELGDMLGYYNTSRRQRMIHINRNSTSQVQRFTCAHELGHMMLHPNINTLFLRKHTLYSIDRIEREANQFAVELLIPDDQLESENRQDVYTVQEAAATYGIPQQLLQLKKLK